MVNTGANRQKAEMRRHRRQTLSYPAWIILGPDTKPIKCLLSDISNSGAKLGISDDQELPDEFILLLSSQGRTRRKCRVIWRQAGRMGVEFFRGPIAEKRTPRSIAANV
jgi:PilZ domain